jgi:hypothetical protein
VSYLRRNVQEAKNFHDYKNAEQEFKDCEKKYEFWKKNLINCIIIEEIVPAIEAVSTDFICELISTQNLQFQIYALFNDLITTAPILYRQSAEFYKMMLAFELMIKEEEQVFHSMSLLKTLPSIQSTRDAITGRRKSSLKFRNRLSICQNTGGIQ